MENVKRPMCDNRCFKKQSISILQDRNKYMVDNSDYLIAVWNGTGSVTGSAVKYVLSKGKFVICIDPKTAVVNKLQ